MKPLLSNLPSLDQLSLRGVGESISSLYGAIVQRDILAKVDSSLVVFGNSLINTQNGEYRTLAEAERPEEQIALTAKALLSRQKQDQQSPPAVLLLLPPGEFMATRFNMMVTGEKVLRSALKLQSAMLIPAYEDELLLGLNGASPEGTALWFPAYRAEALFAAFQNQGLFLAGIMPRSLAPVSAEEQQSDILIVDEDSKHITRIHYIEGAIKAFLTVNKADLEQEEFASQWQQESDKLHAEVNKTLTTIEDWTDLRTRIEGLGSYSFFPRGAEKAGKKIEAGKRRKIAVSGALLIAFLAALPFLNNAFQISRLEKLVDNSRSQAGDIIAAQNAVFDMEQEWGALAEFPRQDVSGIMVALNDIVENSLTSFTLGEGVLDIQGYVQDPAYLVEQLAENEMFFNVIQSRNFSGNRSERGDQFGLRMNVSNVNFEEYDETYIPQQNRR